jgi:hypothetical protein
LRRYYCNFAEKNKNVQVEEQPNMLVAWVGGLAAETVDSLADDQIIDCIGHLVRYMRSSVPGNILLNVLVIFYF